MKKRFTPREANRTLPLVRRIVNDILEKGRVLKSVGPGESADASSAEKEARALEGEVVALMGELESLGCYYRDWAFDVGLVDFPSEIDGRTVMLCWRTDEASVGWYHGVAEGYAGRKPLPPELLDPDHDADRKPARSSR